MKSTIVVPLLLVTPIAISAAASPCDEYQKSGTVVSVGAVGDGSTRSVEIRVDNGAVVAKVDGKPVPESQLRREGDRIVILGPDGKPMPGVPHVTMTDSASAVVQFGDQQMSAKEIVIDGEHGQLRLGPRLQAQIDQAMRQVDQAMGQAGEAGEVIKRYLVDSGLADRARVWFAGQDPAAQNAAPAPKVMLGVTLQDPDAALRRQLGIGENEATLLVDVVEGLPADKAGLESYDLVVKVDGRTPADPDTIRSILQQRNPGESMSFTVRGEGGAQRSVEVTLEPFDRGRLGAAGVFQPDGGDFAGMTAPLIDALRGQLRMAPLDAQRGDFLFELRVPPGGDPMVREGLRWRSSAGDAAGPRFGAAMPSNPSMRQDMGPGAGPGAGQPRPPLPATPDAGSSAAEDPAAEAARLERLERRLDEMSRRLERLMEKLERSAG